MVPLLQQPEVVVAFISAVIGAVIWLVRLEGRLNYGEKLAEKNQAIVDRAIEVSHTRLDTMKEKQEAVEERILSKMSNIEIQLAEITGYLKKRQDG